LRFELLRISASISVSNVCKREAGMKGQRLRIELRMDGQVWARYESQYVELGECRVKAYRPSGAAAQTCARGSQSRRQEPLDGGIFRPLRSGAVAGRSSGRQPELKLAPVNQESRAKAARHLRVPKMQSLRSGVSPKAIGLLFLPEKCKASASASEDSSAAKGILYRKALRTVSNLEGLAPIAFGADSVASVLHLRQGRDASADAARSTPSPKVRSKPELSTLP
jgi:hypothetical protein